jgi:hypothetical protein
MSASMTNEEIAREAARQCTAHTIGAPQREEALWDDFTPIILAAINRAQSEGKVDFSELDKLYMEFKETERVAIWGGSFEREHGAQQHIRIVANKMFDALLGLLKARHEKA